ncbi:hypothetical protein BRADI_4g22988v3 [Brachypodium distachyon]|uniref:Transposase (putative) gypsy type domain-containing protein n=1 Tax=Brachypodium distachyon TaxID=15368 RepID=A0A0Q3ENE4_BRADI|nr:hypothetical protein BRADI_4g22988v3 [Brachypodium distachyon]
MGRKKISTAAGASAAADAKKESRDAPPALDKKSKKTADAAPGDDKKTGEWKRSEILARHFSVVRKHGLILGEDSGKVRVPGNEVTPRPRPGERVVFYDFVIRGLSLPVHFFFHALLLAYGLQMHDLTPNSYLHIACFVTLCECYLGVKPHWGLWKKLFIIKRQGKGDWIYKTGGANIQIESVQQWRSRWFYLQDEPVDGKDFSLPEFSASAQVRKLKSWNHELTAEEDAEASVLLKQVVELQQTPEKEVSGLQLIALFMKRRIQPIQARVHSMWEYLGPSDSTQVWVPVDDDELVDYSNSDALYEDDVDEDEDDHQSHKHGRSSEAEQLTGDSYQHEVPEETIPSSATAASDEPRPWSPSPSAPLTKKAKVTIKWDVFAYSMCHRVAPPGARFFAGEELTCKTSRDGTDSDYCATVDFGVSASYWGFGPGKPCLTEQANRLRDVVELAAAHAVVDAPVKQAKLEAQESFALEKK